MLSPPDDLSDEALVSTLVRGWDLTVDTLTYRPVGFGSHHWELAARQGSRWFVTVDDLRTKRLTRHEPLDSAYARLRASLAAAAELHRQGHVFVVAPVPTPAGEPLLRMDDRFTVALYPFLAGRSFSWGEFSTSEHRWAVLDFLVAIHTANGAVHRHALADDFTVPHRDEVEASLRLADGQPDDDADREVLNRGPYSRRTADLLAANAASVQNVFAHYDELVAAGRAHRSRSVLTHGEPHPGNTMLTSDGWLLIDWDTALVAPPERDLWNLDPGDGSVLRAYAEATGVTPLPSMLELYRIRWDLADIAECVRRFRAPHTGSEDDHATWDILRSLIAHVST